MVSSRSRLALRRASAAAGLVLLPLALAGAAAAQVSPNGDQFQVNTYTTGRQWQAAVASDGDGHFVVAWTSDGSPGTDSSYWSVQARRYDAAGVPLGDQFQVNSYTTHFQYQPAVAAGIQGGFVVVWQSIGSAGTDQDFFSIQGQRFDSLGNPLGGEFQVNSYTTDSQETPDVASDGLGNFVVVWWSYGSFGNDPNLSVQARRFDQDGAPLGAEFQVNSYTTYAQWTPAVAADSQGNFVVAWLSEGSFGNDTSGLSVQARRFDASGTPLGAEFQVNTYTTGHQYFPTVAMDPQGGFVVAWESGDNSGGPDGSHKSIQARRYDASGNPQGDEFVVNSYTTGDQELASLALDSRGNLVIAWECWWSSTEDGIEAQRYDASGSPLGGEFQVESYTTSYQFRSAVAADALGNFVIAWESDGSGGTDQDGYSVQAQRFDDLFRDGFESGDTGRWSSAVP